MLEVEVHAGVATGARGSPRWDKDPIGGPSRHWQTNGTLQVTASHRGEVGGGHSWKLMAYAKYFILRILCFL